MLFIECSDHSYVPKYIYTQLLICELSSSDLENSFSKSASEHQHLRQSDVSQARSPPSAAPSQAKRGRNKRRRQQTSEPSDSEGSGSNDDSNGDGDWQDSCPSKKGQRLESKPSDSKASTTEKTKKRDVKRTSNVVRHEFQRSKNHALLQDTDGNPVASAVFGVYELAGEQGYCERNQAPEIYRRNNMRALRCHYTLTSTSAATNGLLFVVDPAAGKRHLVTSMTFRISGVTSENEREDLPILESDNKRSKWTPTGPKRDVLPHIPPMSDGSVANGAMRFHKSVGVGNDQPKSTHYEWSHLQFQAGTKHNGVRRTTQMFQFMRLSLIAEWGKGEHDRTKVASCAGQRYIVFARSPGGRKTLTKDDKEQSEVTKSKAKSRRREESTPTPGPEQESGSVQRKHNRRGPKPGKRKRQRRHESTPPPTPKAEPESDAEPLMGRMHRKAAQAGRTPRDILHLPSRTQGQEPLTATSFIDEEDEQRQEAEDQRADTPPAHVSRDLTEQELGTVSVPFYGPTDYADSSDFGGPVSRASTEPGRRPQLIKFADESEITTFMEGPTAHDTTLDSPSHFDDAFLEELSSETDTPDVKEDRDEWFNVVELESPEAPAETYTAEPAVLIGVGGDLKGDSQVLKSSSMPPPPRTPNLADIRPPPSSTEDPSPASMLDAPDFAELEASPFGSTFSMNNLRVPSFSTQPGFLMPPSASRYLSTPDISGALNAIGRAGSTAYDWQRQSRQPRTINPSLLLRHETAGVDYDSYAGFDEDEVQKDLRNSRDFWSHQF